MSKQIEALKLALEALEQIAAYRPLTFAECSDAEAVMRIAENAIPYLQEALAEQPAQQEPVAWKDKTYGNLHHQDFGNSIPLYTSPPNVPTARASKPWVGLTDEEILIMSRYDLEYAALIGEVQRKLKEKNDF